VAAIAAILMSATGRAAQNKQLDLGDLVDRLSLTLAGARTWLDRLGTRIGDGRLVERVLFVDVAGETLLAVDGTEGRVATTPEVNAWLSRHSDVILVHNHPAGTGLSENDLMHLTKPWLAAVAAIGHDGSVYVAARGARHAGHGFGSQHQIASTEIERRLNFYFQGPALVSRKTTIRLMLPHLVATALHEASMIEYRASLSASARAVFAPVAGDVDRAVKGAVQRLLAVQRHDRYNRRACR
jgi:hypothetical protein